MPQTITNLPELMSHGQWMKGTGLTLRPRRNVLKELDQEILNYERNPTVFRLASVKGKLKAWQDSKGLNGAWKQDSRNDNGTVTLLDQQVRGLGDTDTAMGAQAFMEPGLINARLGVLYLFSHTYVDDSIFKVVLEGGIDVTTASLGAAGGSAAVRANSVLEKAKTPAGMVAAKIESQVMPQPTRKVIASSQLLSGQATPPTDSWLRRQYEWLRAKLQECAAKLWDAIKEKLAAIRSDPGAAALDMMPGLIRKLCDFLAGQFLKAAAPFIGAGLDIAKGLANTVDSGITKFKEWLSGRNVQLLQGYPATIVEAIRRAMWFSVGEGLYDTMKGGLNLGIQFASQGSGTILTLLASILETLVKTIWKVIELIRMRSFFKQALTHWQSRNERTALHTQPIAVNSWFKRYAVDIPALSVLALNSGICGDKMRFLAMFKDDTSVISQAEFDAGCRYVDGLKVWGSEYLGEAGFSFASDDPVVTGLLKLAQSHTEEQGVAAKAWKFTLGFLNA